MKNESKTLREIYNDKYDPRAMEDNPLLAVEAIGYLKCLRQFTPNEPWIEFEDFMLTSLLMTQFDKKR
ncbi:MAG: hypothetical protein J6T10_22285 [Methanobrevibacter sp.]|nr:hypothetical protein [Methanobrevibacter sp.]